MRGTPSRLENGISSRSKSESDRSRKPTEGTSLVLDVDELADETRIETKSVPRQNTIVMWIKSFIVYVDEVVDETGIETKSEPGRNPIGIQPEHG